MDDATQQLIDVLVSQSNNFKDMLTLAISSILGILVVFLGTNYFTARKFRNDEIHRVKAEIQSNLQSEYISNLKEEIRIELEEKLLKKTEDIQKEQIRLSNKIKHLEQTNKNSNKHIKGEFKIISGDILLKDGYSESAMLDYISAATEFSGTNYHESEIPYVLKKIREAAEKSSHFDGYLIEELYRYLSKLGSEHSATVEKIKAIINEKI